MRVREAYDGEGGGAGVDTDKAKAWKIERLWFESTDPRVTKENLAAVRSRGVGVGIKMNGTGAIVADRMDTRLRDLGFDSNTGPFSCGAMFDDETHQWFDTIELYDEFRMHRPTRYFIITIEPWQAGGIPLELVKKLNADQNVKLAVQDYMDYLGDQLYPADAVAAGNELERIGLLKERLTHFKAVTAGMKFPFGWEGLWWKFNDMPSAPPAAL